MVNIVLLVSLTALFIATFMLSISVSIAANNRISVKGSIKKLDIYGDTMVVYDELSTSFLDRVIVPLMGVFIRVGRKLTPAGFLDTIRHRLVLAGIAKDFNADRFLAFKGFFLILSIALATIFILFVGRDASQVLLSIVFIGLFFFLPDIWLSQKTASRQRAMRLALPDTLDLLTISVEAGLGFDSALNKVVDNTTGPLSEEFYRLLQEVQLGTARSEAFRNLGERTQVDELGSFILAMLQAEVFGITIGKVLRVQAKEMRIKRRQLAEEMAQKAPVKILFPLLLCIFPAVFIVIMGPAAIQIYETLLKSF